MSNLVNNAIPVVLAGGSGTRLWPLSRTDFPKQFLSLNNEKSLLQQTLKRFNAKNFAPPIVVCSERHRFLTAEQLAAIGRNDAHILLEPVARNTAPAIAIAAWQALQANSDAILVVLPADHLIEDKNKFQQTLDEAIQLAEQNLLVTLGITPTHPNTGYGYISSGEPVAESSSAKWVKTFVEKPTLSAAKELIESEQNYWNAGIFIFKASTYLQALESLKPDMHLQTKIAVEKAEQDLEFTRVDEPSFTSCENISVDYAVLEYANNVAVVPFASPWSDIGSWDAVHDATDQDEKGNSSVGDTLHVDSDSTYINASSKLVVAVGTNNLSIIETSDVVLVIDHTNAQSIKNAISVLKEHGRTELDTHQTCYRPWGHYESLKLHPRFQVKRISVKPGAKLSLQKHFHRSEHWVVVKGTAIVTNGEEEILLTENESTYIPLGTMHRLYNPGTIPLELIEVQSGSYLGEDDIVRVGDEYGRA